MPHANDLSRSSWLSPRVSSRGLGSASRFWRPRRPKRSPFGASNATAEPIAAGDLSPGFRTAGGQWPRARFRSGCVAGEGCRVGGSGTSTSPKFRRCSPESPSQSGQTTVGNVFRGRGSIDRSTTHRVVGWHELRAPGCSGCGRHGVSRRVEWSHFKRSHGEFGSSFHCCQHGAVRRVTVWGLRGVRVGEASHPGPRLSRRIRIHRSRSRSVGRVGGGLEERPPSRVSEGSVPPTLSVLAVAPQPIEVVIQDSGSSDGEPLVRPNDGRDVVPKIGGTRRNTYGRFSALCEDTPVPESLVDALEEDLERPRLRLDRPGDIQRPATGCASAASASPGVSVTRVSAFTSNQLEASEDDLPLTSVRHSGRRSLQATQWDSGAEFTLTRASGSRATPSGDLRFQSGVGGPSERSDIVRDSPDSHDDSNVFDRQCSQGSEGAGTGCNSGIG